MSLEIFSRILLICCCFLLTTTTTFITASFAASIDLDLATASVSAAAKLPDGVSIIAATPEIGNPRSDCSNPYNVVVHPLTGTVYASCFDNDPVVGVIAISGSSIRTVITYAQCPAPLYLAISVPQNILGVICNNNQMVFLDLQTSTLISTAPTLSIQTCAIPHNPIFDDRAPIVYVTCVRGPNVPRPIGSVLRLNLVNGTIDIITSPTQFPNPDWVSLDTKRDIIYVGGSHYGTDRSGLVAIHGSNTTMLVPDTECDSAFIQVHPITGVLYFDCPDGTLKGKGTFLWNETTNNYTLAYPSCSGRKIWDIANRRMYTRCGPSGLSFLTDDNQLIPILPDNTPVSSFCKDDYPSMGVDVNVWDVNVRTGMVYLSCYGGPGVLAINVTTVMKNTLPPLSTTPAPGGGSTGGYVSSSASTFLSSLSMICVMIVCLFLLQYC